MLLIGNGRMITRDESAPFRGNGCVAAENGVIAEVGATARLREKYPGAAFLDAAGGVIMPGLINLHNHIYSAFARGLSLPGYAPKGFLDILEGMWWRLDRAMNREDVLQSARYTYLDCIRNGVTTVFDHHASYGAVEGSLSALSEAARELGVRTCLCYEVSDRDGAEKRDAAIRENAAFVREARAHGGTMQRGVMGLHASFTLSDETLEACRAAVPPDTGFHIHVAEGEADVRDCLEKYGKRVVRRLADRGILGKHTIAAHCIHIDGEEMALLRETGTMVIHNPESNMGNAVGCPDVPGMMKRGVFLGLGTDGYTNDMLESYRAANLLHKHHTGDPNAAWSEIPRMLFFNNTRMAERFFPVRLGVLKPGAAADVIVADYDPPTPMNAENCDSHILFGMNGNSVVSTVVAGKILMKNRVVEHADEERILADARTQAASLWRRIRGEREDPHI